MTTAYARWVVLHEKTKPHFDPLTSENDEDFFHSRFLEAKRLFGADASNAAFAPIDNVHVT